MVNMSAVYPPERACGEGSGSSGASRVMPRARAASSRSALAYPLSAACSPGLRPRRASAACTGSVISTSVTGASVVSVLVIRSGAGRRPSASGMWQVSEMCTLYPVQPLPRYRRTARRCHTARPAGIWPAGGPARPPARSPSPALQAELLDPDPAQRLHRGQVAQPDRRGLVVDLPQQQVAVPAVAHGQVGALGRASWQPEVIDPLPVDLLPG